MKEELREVLEEYELLKDKMKWPSSIQLMELMDRIVEIVIKSGELN